MKILKVYHSEPIFEKLSGDKWKVDEDFFCDVILENYGTLQFTIRKGFTFNFRSGPQFLSAFFPKIGDNWLAYLVHDSIYQAHCLSRRRADVLLYHMSRYSGKMGFMSAQTIYQGVRAAGGDAWADQNYDMQILVSLEWADRPRRMKWCKEI